MKSISFHFWYNTKGFCSNKCMTCWNKLQSAKHKCNQRQSLTVQRVTEWGEPTGQPVLQHQTQTVPTAFAFHRHTVITCSASKMPVASSSEPYVVGQLPSLTMLYIRPSEHQSLPFREIQRNITVH
jgi:hypothetical protein